MKHFHSALLLAAITLSSAPARAQATATWATVPGELVQISAAADGTIFGITGEQSVWQWDAGVSNWKQIPGSLTQVTAGSASNVWGISADGTIFKYSGNGNWAMVTGKFMSVSAAADGTVAGVSSTGQPQKWNGSAWTALPGVVRSISTGNAQTIWALDNSNSVFRWSGSIWERMSGVLKQISIAADGTVMGINGNGQPFTWTGTKWEQFSTALRWISPVSKNVAWAVSSSSTVLRTADIMWPGSGAMTLGGNVTVTGSVTVNTQMVTPQVPTWSAGSIPTTPGALKCVNCGTTDANYVGPYTFNPQCATPGDFYFPDWGGTCWRCPANYAGVSGSGLNSWQVKGDVKKDGYCERQMQSPARVGSTMTRGGVNSGVMAWDCASGEFWQMYDNRGNWTWWGGSCYSCPSGFNWNATQSPTSGSDCSKTTETAPVKMGGFNGCPAPDARSMNLSGLRLPDKPFLDIAGGWSQGVASGGCFACPSADTDGSIVITARNVNALIGRPTGNNGCNVLVSYQPAPFVEPGLNGLDGSKSFIFERGLLTVPKAVTAMLHATAENQGLAADSQAARDYVKTQWLQIAANPLASPLFRNFVYGSLQAAVFRDPATRTDGENKLIASFSEYIRLRRIYLAAMSLHMYDSWKAENDKQVAQNRSQLTTMFYYGTVPYDFNSAVQSALGTGGLTAASLAFGIQAVQVASTTTRAMQAAEDAWFVAYRAKYAERARTMAELFQGAARGIDSHISMIGEIDQARMNASYRLNPKSLFQGNLLKSLNVRGAVVALGPALIITIASLMADMAIEQFMEITTARPKLLAAQTQAATPVDLAAMMRDAHRDDVAFILWQKAMEGAPGRDEELVRMATQANNQCCGDGLCQAVR